MNMETQDSLNQAGCGRPPFSGRLKLTTWMFLCAFLASFVCMTGESYGAPTHLDKSKVAGGCRACHKSHGKKGTALLEGAKDTLCLRCHGGGGNAGDVYSVIIKQSRHPLIETSKYHVTGEDLPEKEFFTPRHVSCYDCHNTHRSEHDNAVKGLRGYSGRGAKIKRTTMEYQLCYLCHSDSANLPSEKNIALAFSPANASFHPVETFGKNSSVPSLKKGYTAASVIKCSDCHDNNERSGPRGPHGSIYAPILKERYERVLGPESPAAYALCYNCHNRISIISNDSFKAHKEHIVFNQLSCSFCHDAHGSQQFPNLIKDFGTAAIGSPSGPSVFPNTKGELTYMPSEPGKPRCFLSCHINGKVYDHSLGGVSASKTYGGRALSYCINGRCVPEW